MRVLPFVALAIALQGCAPAPAAELLLVGGRVYTLSWPDPDREGRPNAAAPFDGAGWRPDAEAVAIGKGRILFVGDRAGAERLANAATRTIDLKGATVIPGLIDSHVHLANLGANLERVNLVGVRTPAEAVEKANNTPFGLSAGVWTDKGSRILWMANQLRAGVVWSNTFNRFDPTSPFCGYKESGFGREGGRHGLLPYLDIDGAA